MLPQEYCTNPSTSNRIKWTCPREQRNIHLEHPEQKKGESETRSTRNLFAPIPPSPTTDSTTRVSLQKQPPNTWRTNESITAGRGRGSSVWSGVDRLATYALNASTDQIAPAARRITKPQKPKSISSDQQRPIRATETPCPLFRVRNRSTGHLGRPNSPLPRNSNERTCAEDGATRPA
jgi:hypothetical protein